MRYACRNLSFEFEGLKFAVCWCFIDVQGNLFPAPSIGNAYEVQQQHIEWVVWFV